MKPSSVCFLKALNRLLMALSDKNWDVPTAELYLLCQFCILFVLHTNKLFTEVPIIKNPFESFGGGDVSH